MSRWKFQIPTYHGRRIAHETILGTEEAAYREPKEPIVICSGKVVSICLGTYEWGRTVRPRLLIERHPKGWAIHIHVDGREATGHVYIVDRDNKAQVVPGKRGESIKIVGQIPKELHDI